MPARDEPDLDPALADEVRRTYVRPVGEDVASRHLSAIVAAATAAERSAPQVQRRRRAWRPVLGMGTAVTLLLPVGLAAAGVSLPAVVEKPYAAVGIELPNQAAEAPAPPHDTDPGDVDHARGHDLCQAAEVPGFGHRPLEGRDGAGPAQDLRLKRPPGYVRQARHRAARQLSGRPQRQRERQGRREHREAEAGSAPAGRDAEAARDLQAEQRAHAGQAAGAPEPGPRQGPAAPSNGNGQPNVSPKKTLGRA